MNFIILYWIAGIMAFLLVLFITIMLYLSFRQAEEPENQQILENFLPQYSDGHTDGIVSNIEFGEERIKISFFPRDVNYIKEFNKNKGFKLKEYTIFYDKRQVVPIANGGFSAHRDKIKAFPDRIELLPEGLLNTPYGKKIAEMISKNNELRDESQILNSRLGNLKRISMKTAGGGIFEDYLTKSTELITDIKDTLDRKDNKFMNVVGGERK